MLAKFLTVKVAAVALTAAVAVGGVAAAATVAQSDRVAGKAVADVDKPDAAEHAGGSQAGGSQAGGSDASGPDATGAARKGLCRAWAAGKGAEHGAKEDAAAFRALADAAGGADKVASFCADAATTGKGEAVADTELADTPAAAPSTPTTSLPTPSTRAGRDDHPAPPTSVQPRGSAPDDPGKPSA